ncbi:unnamed protein product [Caenorhabditis auriculariae]|uniref:CYtochrome P450 family n=1 Tax=Caenorhabditis auriculariae TaxID=2777116 RepID=A0A8S1HNA8_9PELO|nr:unnamed protein product [Caenorhabditis auriculariae]
MIFLLLLCGFFAYLSYKQRLVRSKLPRGPFPFPFIGNVPQLLFAVAKTGGIVKAIKTFKEEYGPVFTLWMGPKPTVHIADYEIAYQEMVKNGGRYTDRYIPEIFLEVRKGLGMIFANGRGWLEQRRFSLHTLRNFGVGRSIIEERILKELNTRFAAIERDASNGVMTQNIGSFFDLVFGNVIYGLMFSLHFEENDQKFEKLKGMLGSSFEKFNLFDISVPLWVLKSPFFKWRFDSLTKPIIGIIEFCSEQVNKRLAKIKSGEHIIADEPQDFVDAYLKKINEESNNNGTYFDLETLNVNLLDLWVAGQETTSITLLWGMILLLNNPEHITKIREEVNRITGNGSRQLSLSDKSEAAYLNATIHEIQRHASILNLNMWRIAAEGVVLNGEPVEAGTVITAQLNLAHNVSPFGMGKRACLGESLARAELFLILGNFILRYDIKPSGDLPSVKTINPNGILKRPPKCEVELVKLT